MAPFLRAVAERRASARLSGCSSALYMERPRSTRLWASSTSRPTRQSFIWLSEYSKALLSKK